MRISFAASAAGAVTGLIARTAIIAAKPRRGILNIVVILREEQIKPDRAKASTRGVSSSGGRFRLGARETLFSFNELGYGQGEEKIHRRCDDRRTALPQIWTTEDGFAAFAGWLVTGPAASIIGMTDG